MRSSGKKPGVDVILDVLLILTETYPDSTFIKSLLAQYRERGSLSRKQLQGLLSKGQKASSVPETKLSTIEAIILRMPVRDKTPPSATNIPPEETKDPHIEEQIQRILSVFPYHKRVLYLKARVDNNEILNALEIKELTQFEQTALKKNRGN
jgi:hypothetical protein